MAALSALYGTSLALLTDLYQLTMAYGYFKLGRAGREAVFHLTYRRHPFAGGYSVACGLEYVIDYVSRLRFESADLEYLAGLNGDDGRPLFDGEFLDELRSLRPAIDIDAVPEGTVVFPHEPILRVRGPIMQCQLLETPILNMINFQSLIATKAARIAQAAGGESVLEFGLRRAHGVDGAVTVSRAAYIGGCSHTSNVLAGRLFGIPVRGTHAHSWVMSFDEELESFAAYAQAMPNNCLFLVDTYDTLEGVRRAIAVGRDLRRQGYELAGVRLDSGDLAYLSIEARRLLDEAGFERARILASNDLDEHIIHSLKEQGAAIDTWGVGTRLATAYDQPSMGGVYKLSAVRGEDGRWKPRLKLSEQAIKISTPGQLRVRRYRDRAGMALADVIYDEELGIGEPCTMVDPLDPTRRRVVEAGTAHDELLVPIFRGGRRVYEPPSIHDMRQRVQEQLQQFHAGVRRFVNPHAYPVGLERSLHDLKTALVLRARGHTPDSSSPLVSPSLLSMSGPSASMPSGPVGSVPSGS